MVLLLLLPAPPSSLQTKFNEKWKLVYSLSLCAHGAHKPHIHTSLKKNKADTYISKRRRNAEWFIFLSLFLSSTAHLPGGMCIWKKAEWMGKEKRRKAERRGHVEPLPDDTFAFNRRSRRRPRWWLLVPLPFLSLSLCKLWK